MLDDRAALVAYRRELARERLADARLLLGHGSLRSALNRAYYAALAMATASLISRGISVGSHSAANRQVGLHLVKPGAIPREVGRLLPRLDQIRGSADYADFAHPERAEVEAAIRDAETFLAAVEATILPDAET